MNRTIEWEPAESNAEGVTTKKGKCGCEVILGRPCIINACCDEHHVEIRAIVEASPVMQGYYDGTLRSSHDN